MLIFVVLLVILLVSCVPGIPDISGTAYFVDCSDGDDSRTGTSSSNAWGSLERVNRMVTG